MIFTGRGSSGSWQIRGVQLGVAVGATVIPKATNVKGQQVVVVKKNDGCDLTGASRSNYTTPTSRSGVLGSGIRVGYHSPMMSCGLKQNSRLRP